MSTFNPTSNSLSRYLIYGLILLIFLVPGCGYNAAPQPNSAEPVAQTGAGPARPTEEASVPVEAPALESATEEEGIVRMAEEAPAAAPAEAEAAPDRDSTLAGGESAGAALPTSAVMLETEAEMAESSVEMPQQTSPLRAGEVDDNAQWDDYLLYRRNYQGPAVHDWDVSERYIIEVKDGQGNPVLGATVRVFLAGQNQRQEIYSAQTYATGQVLFHPLALDLPMEQVDHFLVEVQQADLVEQFTLTRLTAQASTAFSERWTVTLDTRTGFDSIPLDVLFLIDTTGSMADEIAKIQSTIFDVAARIDALPGQPQARYGMVTYRDRGDSFVTNTYEFTPDVQDFSAQLSTVYADGGGDYPESLNEGLYKALHEVEWRGGSSVQLIFLIADAPPHLDYPQDYDYAVEMDNAARQGIKIFPIASSGLDDQGEYIFRQLAQYTQGRFIFLTYAGPTNGGEPGDVTTHHVDDYSVANLDDLLVNIVSQELAYQNPQLTRQQ